MMGLGVGGIGIGKGGARRGARYYVDSVNGDDGNTGTSAATAFATLGAVSVSPGSSVYVARGSHWRETIALADGSKLIAYGDGDAPLIDASDVIPNANFTLTPTRSNTYQATVALDDVGAGNGFHGLWRDDVHLARVTSVATVESTPGSYYFSTEAGTSATLYVHPTGSANPTTDGAVYEYSARQYSVNARYAAGVTVEGIRTRRQSNIGGSLWTGVGARITDVLCEDGSNHCLQYMEGSVLTRVVAKNCYFTLDQPTHFVLYQSTATGLGCQHIDCEAVQDGAAVIAYGYFGHCNSGDFGTVTYDGCSATNITRGWGGAQGTYVVNDPVFNCSASGAYAVFGTSGATYELTGGAYTGLTNLVRLSSGPAPTVRINGVTAVCGADVLSCTESVTSPTIEVTDCTLTEGSTSSTAGFVCFSAALAFSMHGTRLTTSGTHRYFYFNAAATLDCDNNIYVGNKRFRNAGTDYANLAAWQAATGQDANSVIA